MFLRLGGSSREREHGPVGSDTLQDTLAEKGGDAGMPASMNRCWQVYAYQ